MSNYLLPLLYRFACGALLLTVAGALWCGGAGAHPSTDSPTEPVMLGSADLVAGIPGTGPVTPDEIREWLADPANHVPLKPQLPTGLAAGATEIEGLTENPLTRAKIELGRQLYFDGRLSSDESISCASCHDPQHGFADRRSFSLGVNDQQGGRNAPAAYNRLLSDAQFHDGRAASLEDQATGPIANPIEMSNTHDACVGCLAGIEGYRLQFGQLFADGLTIENVARAIACFERVIVTGTSPWDHHERLASFEKAYADDLEYLDELEEEDPDLYDEYQELLAAARAEPVGEAAVRGGELFFGKAKCSVCHHGANYTDEQYHNLGVGMDADEPDLGRFEVTGEDEDRGAFKTPTLRNVELTAPYMHDGSLKTLGEVIDWYDKGGHENAWLSADIAPLGLGEQEKADLVAFLESLTGPLPKVETGRLPE